MTQIASVRGFEPAVHDQSPSSDPKRLYIPGIGGTWDEGATTESNAEGGVCEKSSEGGAPSEASAISPDAKSTTAAPSVEASTTTERRA